MRGALTVGSRRISPVALLGGLVALAVLAAILTPETKRQGGGLTSYSTGPGGARIMFDLARRMGWTVVRREAPLDSLPQTSTVQVVIGPEQALGAHEVHRLLDNVRMGGGLIFSVDDAAQIADSIGLAIRTRARLLIGEHDRSCRRSRTFAERRVSALPPTVHEIVWRRPPPGPTSVLSSSASTSASGRDMGATVALGFTLGRGHVAAVSGSEVFANDVLRTCEWGADVLVARSLDFVRSESGAQPLVFDEFHHGRGVHAGSMRAIVMFLSGTSAGRFVATLLVAGLILVFAAAPRPIVPTEPERLVRRSPLEHADALGRAYADVGATRTAASRLVGGVRRRAGRSVAVERNADDRAFLEAIARRAPSLAPTLAVVQRAIREPVSPRDFAAVGAALENIEHVLLTSPSAGQ